MIECLNKNYFEMITCHDARGSIIISIMITNRNISLGRDLPILEIQCIVLRLSYSHSLYVIILAKNKVDWAANKRNQLKFNLMLPLALTLCYYLLYLRGVTSMIHALKVR